MRQIVWIPVMLAALLCVSCEKVEETTVVNTADPEAPPLSAAHHKGESCDACHTDWNIVQLHDASSPEYNNDCILCHGDMKDETTLDATVAGIHPVMCPEVFTLTGQTETNNTVCIYCHKSVDILGGSAASLRKQVASDDCRTCHTVAGPGRELFE